MTLEGKFIYIVETCLCDRGENPPADPNMYSRVPGGCVKCKGSKVFTTKITLSQLKEMLNSDGYEE